MGLSSFEESSPPPYCSPALDRLSTNCLIEVSCSPSKSSYRFAHNPAWADGLDPWSTIPARRTDDLHRRHFDFHTDLGLYLPRHEKPNSAPTSFKGACVPAKTMSTITPERIRQLLLKEKEIWLQNDSAFMLSDQHPPPPPLPPPLPPPPPPPPTNSCRDSLMIESASAPCLPTPIVVPARLPLRHTTNDSPTLKLRKVSIVEQPSSPSLNQDALRTLLKEHLTSLLTRGASILNHSRTVISVPTMEIKHNNVPLPSRPPVATNNQPESTQIMQRYAKLQELMISPPASQQTTSSNRSSHSQNRSPLLVFQRASNLGLTVTPVDLTAPKHFESCSLEKMAQQRGNPVENDSSSVGSSRPPTQPVPMPPSSTVQYHHQQQRVVLKRHLEAGVLSPGDPTVSGEVNSKVNEQQHTPPHRKHPVHPRLSSKGSVHRTTVPTATGTLDILPPIIAGKRLHIPLGNHRYM